MFKDICRFTRTSSNRNSAEIPLKSEEEIQFLRESAALVRDLIIQLKKIIKPGINELDISSFCENYILLRNGDPVLKSDGLFPYAVLLARNNEAFHCMPQNRFLEEGDILSVDIVLKKNGWYGDGAWTFEVGQCSQEIHRLVEFSSQLIRECVVKLEEHRDFASLGKWIFDRCYQEGFRVIEEGAGHGIGQSLHEDPLVLFSLDAEPLKVEKGMVFTIEPVITNYMGKLTYDSEGGAYVKEGYYASQFEHMIAATEKGLEILTDPLTLFK